MLANIVQVFQMSKSNCSILTLFLTLVDERTVFAALCTAAILRSCQPAISQPGTHQHCRCHYDINNNGLHVTLRAKVITVKGSEQTCYLVESETDEPSQHSVVDCTEPHPAFAYLLTNGCQCGDTREIKQDKQHHSIGGYR